MLQNTEFEIASKSVNIKAPQNIQAYLRLVARKAILTWDKLQKRRWQGPGFCCLCSKDIEMLEHIFFPMFLCKGDLTESL